MLQHLVSDCEELFFLAGLATAHISMRICLPKNYYQPHFSQNRHLENLPPHCAHEAVSDIISNNTETQQAPNFSVFCAQSFRRVQEAMKHLPKKEELTLSDRSPVFLFFPSHPYINFTYCSAVVGKRRDKTLSHHDNIARKIKYHKIC